MGAFSFLPLSPNPFFGAKGKKCWFFSRSSSLSGREQCRTHRMPEEKSIHLAIPPSSPLFLVFERWNAKVKRRFLWTRSPQMRSRRTPLHFSCSTSPPTWGILQSCPTKWTVFPLLKYGSKKRRGRIVFHNRFFDFLLFSWTPRCYPPRLWSSLHDRALPRRSSGQ